jgi:hypothetical protein
MQWPRRHRPHYRVEDEGTGSLLKTYGKFAVPRSARSLFSRETAATA